MSRAPKLVQIARAQPSANVRACVTSPTLHLGKSQLVCLTTMMHSLRHTLARTWCRLELSKMRAAACGPLLLAIATTAIDRDQNLA